MCLSTEEIPPRLSTNTRPPSTPQISGLPTSPTVSQRRHIPGNHPGTRPPPAIASPAPCLPQINTYRPRSRLSESEQTAQVSAISAPLPSPPHRPPSAGPVWSPSLLALPRSPPGRPYPARSKLSRGPGRTGTSAPGRNQKSSPVRDGKRGMKRRNDRMG